MGQAKAKEKGYIDRLADKAREKYELKERERKNTNVVNRVAVEDADKIRFSADIQGAKRERAVAQEWAKAEADIKEKAEKTRE